MSELTVEYRTWMCLICGYLYDERSGDPNAGIAAGTRWDDIPDDWRCPECDVPKLDFEMVSI
ncbi:rubredoxin [Burkholderia gladioli]|uniref:rubredoxin n=1 Tax=Burkholderia gladioli TaxID=28095 RepID=UPI000CFE98A6|nr:rubredoxin [Burkholderia gladioli]PRG99411.1 rubredoxin [Burkholderia gladioli]